jgi:hypothetical protein
VGEIRNAYKMLVWMPEGRMYSEVIGVSRRIILK